MALIRARTRATQLRRFARTLLCQEAPELPVPKPSLQRQQARVPRLEMSGNLSGLSLYQYPLLSPVSRPGFPGGSALPRSRGAPHTPLRSASLLRVRRPLTGLVSHPDATTHLIRHGQVGRPCMATWTDVPA